MSCINLCLVFEKEKLWKVILTSLVFTLGVSCSPKNVKVKEEAENHYKQAQRYMEKKDCVKAQEEFKIITYNFAGSQLVDDAQFGLAEAYYCAEDYTTAGLEYEKLINDFPLSSFASQASFKLALCYLKESLPSSLDQENTRKAIQQFQRFLEDYPSSPLVPEGKARLKECYEKLAKKDFDNAMFYKKMGRYESALIYMNSVVENYPDTEWACEAHYETGEILLVQGKKEEALEALQRALKCEQASKRKKYIQDEISRIQEKK